ncbi:SDR family NAD(P)-dependent oxidoreductase [Microbacterium lacticum]|uniref:SDR family NAD(P)-dependent oxidoreductase n=1 Tax=Microbacterium lacticum TaxID=33885 RepID=UPI0018B06333|nr:SDR family NAD(P)-dependent oxidoreductase [Microbacterium lacticum]MBF9337045.1 SDR family NAD(P)-dependent oxidoreductase [Microbacterium lacticum]
MATPPVARHDGGISRSSRVLIMGGSPENRDAIATDLRARGVRLVDSVGDGPSTIIDAGMWGRSDSDWRTPFRETIKALRAVKTTWSSEQAYGKNTYVAVVGGASNGAPPAEHGIWSGLAKSVPREYPTAIGRVVELPEDAANAGGLLSDALTSTMAIEVRHDGQTLSTPLAVTRSVIQTARSLGEADTVVMTGGARGIGYALAVGLARRGAHVIVSGRDDLDEFRNEEWVRLDEADFREQYHLALIDAKTGRLAEVRKEFERRTRIRALLSNLAAAEQEGLILAYERCDVHSAQSVQQLFNRAIGDISVVVHNAGIDDPKRLDQKTTASMEHVISVKLDGLRNVQAAMVGRNVGTLALTGSLTGRYGGMRGQLDYSAANETLAFASREETNRSYRVMCTSWPTWNGVGLISNMEAARQYMEPIDVAEGVRAWIDELEHDSRGEVAFMGEFAAVSAQHLQGVPIPSNWSGAGEMLARRFFLGEVASYQPDARIVTTHRLPLAATPWLASASVDRAAALPLSAVVEYLVRSTDGFLIDLGEVCALNNLVIHLDVLEVDDQTILTRTARLIDHRHVEVVLARQRDGAEVLLARAVLRCEPRSDRHIRTAFVEPQHHAGTGEIDYKWPSGEMSTLAFLNGEETGLFGGTPELPTKTRSVAIEKALAADRLPAELRITQLVVRTTDDQQPTRTAERLETTDA